MSVKKYLQHYAEGDIEFAKALTGQWQHVICIPAFDEAKHLPTLLERLSTENDLLVIVIINSPESADIPKARSQQLAENIKQQFSLQQILANNCQLLTLNDKTTHLLLIEHYSIPEEEGVGLVRKIACDVACQLINDQKVISPWIYSTDADVTLPSDYFLSSKTVANDYAAALFAFKHQDNSDKKIQSSLLLYEYSLFYYVEALRWAGSGYAFHTIGSTLLLNYHHYALARGFPKRAAGEDFYLLNKLKKIGKIHSFAKPVLTLSGRTSNRVPFGTGPALNTISQFKSPEAEYLFYHPHCFLQLKNWLALLPSLWDAKDLNVVVSDELLLTGLKQIGTEKALIHSLQNSKNQESFVKHMHNWFDAFKTLKLVHSLRDLKLSSINKAQLQLYQKDFPFIAIAEDKQNA